MADEPEKLSKRQKHDSLSLPSPSTHPPPGTSSSPLTPAYSYLHLDPEKIIKNYGKYGTYQMIIYAMSNMGSMIYAMETMIMSLIAAEQKHVCISDNADYDMIDKCTVRNIYTNLTKKCGTVTDTRFEFPNFNRNTLITEFDLICDKSYWSQHGTSIFMIGGLIMAPFLSQMADRYGRKFCFLIPLWLTVLSNIACSMSRNFYFFLLFRFIAGLGTAGIGTVSYVIQIESVTASFRSMTPLIGTFVWVSGYMAVGVLYLIFDDWRKLYLAMALPGLVTFSFYWLMPESLHWSITNNRTKNVQKYIKSSSRINKREIQLVDCKVTDRSDSTMERASSRTVFDIFKKKSLLLQLVLHCFIMMTMNGTYWALSLFSVDLHEDELVGYFLSGLVELPAGFIAIALLSYFGRRTVTFLSFICTAICMFMAVLLPGKNYISMSFPLLAKMFNSITWASEPLLIGEMSPTSVRNVFYGLVAFVGEIASVFAPYLNYLKQIHELAPPITMTTIALLAGAFVLTSPETKDKALPEDLDDFDEGPFYRWLSGNKKEEARLEDDKQKENNVPLL
ncbi:unnamed protein product [Bursaphelenchus okinawaensis]|uniref:Major facilitator superfamily (MFS) profile domain-containing protein n=1 Tax=Bursaphelenchus okinawaensis TaxID=465554 RepID=A0A811LBK6_9BILA|nr:unnamed protein product [Bursaphelenchus okinawaensis]CAG9121022.1 unnamed protein product [Bursaphelenchus okinawaensis]